MSKEKKVLVIENMGDFIREMASAVTGVHLANIINKHTRPGALLASFEGWVYTEDLTAATQGKGLQSTIRANEGDLPLESFPNHPHHQKVHVLILDVPKEEKNGS